MSLWAIPAVIFGVAFLFWFIRRTSKDMERREKAIEMSALRALLSDIKTEVAAKALITRHYAESYSYKKGDDLTLFECHFLWWKVSTGRPCCPDCDVGEFIQGPEGGATFNIRCNNENCGSAFWTIAIIESLGFKRITDRSPNRHDVVSFGPHR